MTSSGGRTRWAHVEFTRINIAPTWSEKRSRNLRQRVGGILNFYYRSAASAAMDASVRQNGIFETVDGHDPLALGLIAVVMLIVGAAGACAPAHRAAAINPVEALRSE